MGYSLCRAALWTLVICTLIVAILSEPLSTSSSIRTESDYGNTSDVLNVSFDPNRAYVADIASSLGTQLELSISAINLPQREILTKPYPMCVLYTRPFVQDSFQSVSWTEYDRTETIEDEANPKFVKKITMPYVFEEKLVFEFKLYDRRYSRSENVDERYLLGFVYCNQSELIRHRSMRLKLKRLGSSGTEHAVRGAYVVITAEKLMSNYNEVVMKLSGVGLDDMDWFGVSDPYIKISRVASTTDDEKDDVVVYRSKVIKNSLNPEWDKFTIPIKTLCNGEKNRPLKFVCWDWDWNKAPDLIGEFVTTLDEIDSLGKREFELINPKKIKKRNYKNSGIIKITEFEVVEVPSFADFLRGGLQILCSIVIDFTISNGDPHLPTSLHYRDPKGNLNQYEDALISVVAILEDYDSDKLFPVYGFGAEINNEVRHDFNVNLKLLPHCEGIKGVLSAYRECLNTVQLARPTYFARSIKKIVDAVKNNDSKDNYYIITILTSGDIMDMEQTEKVIREGAELPISIIIIGIGQRNFDLMKKLDKGDGTRRDIVQFVSFEEFKQQTDHNIGLNLARKVLAEVPDQVVWYMRSRNIKPEVPILTLSPSMSMSYSDIDSMSLQQDYYQDESRPDNVNVHVPAHLMQTYFYHQFNEPPHHQFSHIPEPSLSGAPSIPPDDINVPAHLMQTYDDYHQSNKPPHHQFSHIPEPSLSGAPSIPPNNINVPAHLMQTYHQSNKPPHHQFSHVSEPSHSGAPTTTNPQDNVNKPTQPMQTYDDYHQQSNEHPHHQFSHISEPSHSGAPHTNPQDNVNKPTHPMQTYDDYHQSNKPPHHQFSHIPEPSLGGAPSIPPDNINVPAHLMQTYDDYHQSNKPPHHQFPHVSEPSHSGAPTTTNPQDNVNKPTHPMQTYDDYHQQSIEHPHHQFSLISEPSHSGAPQTNPQDNVNKPTRPMQTYDDYHQSNKPPHHQFSHVSEPSHSGAPTTTNPQDNVNKPTHPMQTYDDYHQQSIEHPHHQFSHVPESSHTGTPTPTPTPPPPPPIYTFSDSQLPHPPYQFDGFPPQPTFQYPYSTQYAPIEPFYQPVVPPSSTNFGYHSPEYSVAAPNQYPIQHILPSYFDPSNSQPHLDPNIIHLSHSFPQIQSSPSYIFQPNILPPHLHHGSTSSYQIQTESIASSQSYPSYGTDANFSSTQTHPSHYFPGSSSGH